MAAFSLSALHGDGAAHGVYDVLGDGQPHSGAGLLVHAGIVLPGKRIEDPGLEFLSHADAVVPDMQMGADVELSQGRGLLI